MNPLELLKERLRVKPVVQEKEVVEIIVPKIHEKIDLGDLPILDERDKSAIDRSAIIKKLEEMKIKKTITKESVKIGSIEFTEKKEPVKKATKLTKKVFLKLEEDVDEPGEKGVEETIVVKRRTPKHKKGVVILPPEEWVDIDRLPTISRLPPKMPPVNIKVSSYIMNNREKFVNFINSMFGQYRDEITSNSSQITCDSIGQDSTEFSLLTHQKLVRDYINLYTPYRGLLLYHGLGSGKTCTSIAIAEGIKTSKKVIIMTPASLRKNYMEELKKCGDSIYKKNQYWKWIDIKKHPDAVETLSSVLNLSVEYIQKKKGAWLVNNNEESNYDTLDPNEIKNLNEQIDEMIQTKYKFINYNGLRRDKLKEMTDNFETNIFDNAVVIIDEAHNLISRIVNKLAKEKEIAVDKNGKKERIPYSLAMILYEFLMSSKNTRIVLLTGTPIINYPNEIAILFNILRGYIKTWEIPLDIKTGQAVTNESLHKIFEKEKILDYVSYAKDKVLSVTRNPYGFDNKIDRSGDNVGVTNDKKKHRDDSGKLVFKERDEINDDIFEKRIIRVLSENNISVNPAGVKIKMFKALPDKFEDFAESFIDAETGDIKNIDLFKRRIIGLTSYFRSAQEKLLPRYEKLHDFHVIKIPMSDYQFGIYEAARAQERKQEKSSKQKKGKVDANGIYQDPSSTYRIFSRLYCNFVMPKPPGRPLPKEEKEEVQIEKNYEEALKATGKRGPADMEGAWDGEIEGDEAIDNLADTTYSRRIELAIDYLKEHEAECLTADGLQTYSPKYLHILENIIDPDHIGLHLLYSQFRTLEGIGIFKMVLEANGFTQFKIKRDSNGIWELDISEENLGKPKFALYTGTESAEEKEIIRNIYNSNWDTKSPITSELKKIAHNNNMGEIIKVLMITASGSEGINLRCTRYVHIMEPYWHPARTEQVVGRARRICSHKDLDESLQTVEVFLYLMTFTQEQIKSDASIELKRKDLSKKKYKVAVPESASAKAAKDAKEIEIPFTSDEALYEIATIKETVSSKIILAIKEASIDCAIYSTRGSKEQLNCLNFGEPSIKNIAYIPNYKKQEPDTTLKINKKVIEWRGREFEFRGKTYIYRKLDSTHGNLYDKQSYLNALENPKFEPQLVANVEETDEGMVIKKIV